SVAGPRLVSAGWTGMFTRPDGAQSGPQQGRLGHQGRWEAAVGMPAGWPDGVSAPSAAWPGLLPKSPPMPVPIPEKKPLTASLRALRAASSAALRSAAFRAASDLSARSASSACSLALRAAFWTVGGQVPAALSGPDVAGLKIYCFSHTSQTGGVRVNSK